MTWNSDLILPALILGAAGWLVPRGLALVFPEGVRPLLWLTATSIAVMLVLSALFFAALYLRAGAPVSVIIAPAVGLRHFLRLGLASALIWAPITLLTVASLPKHWKTRTW